MAKNNYSLLENACALWLLGEWQILDDLHGQLDEKHPDYAQLLLYTLAARLQTLSQKQDKETAVAAIKKQIKVLSSLSMMQKIKFILFSGVHNSLARANCVNNRMDEAKKYFYKALEIYRGIAPSPSLIHVRTGAQLQQLQLNGVKIEERKSLKQLYEEHDGYVSDKWSLYLDIYNEIFSGLRDKPISLLEIGIQNGGSLEIWSRFFYKHKKIIGCDINPECGNIKYKNNNIHIIIGDVNNQKTKETMLKIENGFDIVIDDGSHKSSDIIKTFFNYFSQVKEDGFFVAEDLHCSYWEKFEGGLGYKRSSMEFFKLLADILNYEHWPMKGDINKFLEDFRYACVEEKCENILFEIHSIIFFNSICIIRKKRNILNILGLRFVSGIEESVARVKHVNNTYSSPH